MKIYIQPKILEVYKSKKRLKLLKGGRGSGKSYGTATLLISEALKSKKRILCTKETQNSLQDSALAILKRVIDDHNLTGYFTMTKQGLECKNGSVFIFKGLQFPDRIKSLEGIDIAWVEEAQSLTKNAIQVLLPTIRKTGSVIWFTYNPQTEEDPISNLENHPQAITKLINYYDNPFFTDELKDLMVADKLNDPEKYYHVWEGHPLSISDSLIFKHKYRVADFTIPENTIFYHGLDLGMSNDPTAAVRCFINDNILYIDHELYLYKQDAALENLTTALVSCNATFFDWPIIMENAWPQSYDYLKKQNYKVKPVKKHKVLDGINFLKSFTEIVIHPRCVNTIYEFSHYSWKLDKRTNEPIPEPEDKFNHIIDALRYALSEVFRSGVQNKLTSDQMYLLARALR